MKVEITKTPVQDDIDYVVNQTREYNAKFVPNESELLSVFCRSEKGEIIAGLTAMTFWDWLHVEYLWVNEV